MELNVGFAEAARTFFGSGRKPTIAPGSRTVTKLSGFDWLEKGLDSPSRTFPVTPANLDPAAEKEPNRF